METQAIIADVPQLSVEQVVENDGEIHEIDFRISETHEARILNSLSNLQKNNAFCDFTIKAKVSGEEFKVHSLVLAAASPYISDHLHKVESCLAAFPECVLPVTSNCVQALVDFIYTGRISTGLMSGDINDLRHLAEEWKMQDLTAVCMYVLDQINSLKEKSEGNNSGENTVSNINLDGVVFAEVPADNAVGENLNKTAVSDKPKKLSRKNDNRPKKYVGRRAKVPPGVIEDRISRPFVCKMCKADFVDKSNCREHLISEHQISVDHVDNFMKFPSRMPKCFPAVLPKCYRCAYEGCNFVSLVIYDVLYHRFTEHNIPMPENRADKVAVCSMCGKIFNGKVGLERHMNHHLGIRPHLCDVCPSSFTSKSTLKKHVRRCHGIVEGANEKWEYPCPQCDFVAATLYNLKNHMLKHGKREMFACHKCPFKTISHDALKGHFIKCHKGSSQGSPVKQAVAIDSWTAEFEIEHEDSDD